MLGPDAALKSVESSRQPETASAASALNVSRGCAQSPFRRAQQHSTAHKHAASTVPPGPIEPCRAERGGALGAQISPGLSRMPGEAEAEQTEGAAAAADVAGAAPAPAASLPRATSGKTIRSKRTARGESVIARKEVRYPSFRGTARDFCAFSSTWRGLHLASAQPATACSRDGMQKCGTGRAEARALQPAQIPRGACARARVCT